MTPDSSGVSIDQLYPMSCVLCDHSAETTMEHERHMEETHDV